MTRARNHFGRAPFTPDHDPFQLNRIMVEIVGLSVIFPKTGLPFLGSCCNAVGLRFGQIFQCFPSQSHR
jgi:hypothetical protein